MTGVELSLVLASALLHALWSMSIKGSRDPLVFNFYQGGVSLALALVVLPLVAFEEISPTVWRWLALTVVAHALYFYWLTRALERGDLTLVYVPRAVVFYTLLASVSALLFSPLVLARRGFRAVRAGARVNALPASLASALGLLGYGLILKALETAPASYTVAVRQSSVLFVIVLGVLQLRENGRTRILGAAATVVGVGLIALWGGP